MGWPPILLGVMFSSSRKYFQDIWFRFGCDIEMVPFSWAPAILLWGYLKANVYKHWPQIPQQLEEVIREEIAATLRNRSEGVVHSAASFISKKHLFSKALEKCWINSMAIILLLNALQISLVFSSAEYKPLFWTLKLSCRALLIILAAVQFSGLFQNLSSFRSNQRVEIIQFCWNLSSWKASNTVSL